MKVKQDQVLKWASRICAVVAVLLLAWVIRLHLVLKLGPDLPGPLPGECPGGPDSNYKPTPWFEAYADRRFYEEVVPYQWALAAAVALTVILLVLRARLQRREWHRELTRSVEQ